MNLNGMLKENSLKDKTILVTGGATGLGKSMAKYFLELGANIVIASRKQESLDKTANELMKECGGNVVGISCDVRNYDEVENTLEKINVCIDHILLLEKHKNSIASINLSKKHINFYLRNFSGSVNFRKNLMVLNDIKGILNQLEKIRNNII